MVDAAEYERKVAIESLRSKQNLAGGIVAGSTGAVVGAAVWAAVTAASGYQIAWMAIGVGFLVGLAVRTVGKGIDRIFGYVGAALSLLGCLLGNYFTVVWFVAAEEGIAFLDVLLALGPAAMVELISLTFAPMDLLFYAIAIYFGYRYSFTPIAPSISQ